jgi:hypothetical protein
MKTLFLIVCVSFVYLSPAEGLLPPLYQSMNEYKALLDDPRFSEAFTSGEVLVEIERKDNLFFVTTNRSKMQVTIHYDQKRRIGPAQFYLEFSPAVPLTPH